MSDRSRDVSDELTEVRTVLSRAETALARLDYYEKRRGEPLILGWATSEETGKYGPVYGAWETDPYIEDMKISLMDVINILTRWRKAGTTASQRHRRWIAGE